jgi:hypothetical protein
MGQVIRQMIHVTLVLHNRKQWNTFDLFTMGQSLCCYLFSFVQNLLILLDNIVNKMINMINKVGSLEMGVRRGVRVTSESNLFLAKDGAQYNENK